MAQPSPREKLKFAGLLVGGAIPLGLAGWLRSLEAAPAIAPPRALDLPDPNGYDLYVAAEHALPEFQPPVDACLFGLNRAQTAAEGAMFYSLERREAWNEAAQLAWELFSQAQRTQTVDPIVPNFEGDPNYDYLRSLARAKRAQSNLFRMRGDHENAVAAALDGVEMGIAMARGGAQLGRSVSAAIVDDSIAAINDTDRLPDRLTAPIARAAMQRLEALIGRLVAWPESIERERDFQLAELERHFESDNWRARQIEPHPPTPNLRQRVSRRLTSKKAAVAAIERDAEYAIVVHNAFYDPEDCARLASTTDESPFAYRRTRFVAACERTRLDLLLLRLALCAYRGERGIYPRFLGELCGEYLHRIPFDPFSPVPYRPYNYTFGEGSYCLWSVGPDGEDDGGAPILFERAPRRGLLWNKHLPWIKADSKGDVVAGETR